MNMQLLRAAWQWGAAVALRLLLAALGAGDALLWQPEVSTPANTLLKTREGLRLLQLGVPPYQGASCHVPPLWLAVVAPWAHHPLLYVLPSIACDLVAAAALCVASAALFSSNSNTAWLRHKRDAPWLSPGQLGLLYLYNPFVLLSCVAGTLTSAENAAIMLAVAGGCLRNAPLAGFGLALGAYLGLHPLLLLVPVLLLMWCGPEDVLQHVGAQPGQQLGVAGTSTSNSSSRGGAGAGSSLQVAGAADGAIMDAAAGGGRAASSKQQLRQRHASSRTSGSQPGEQGDRTQQPGAPMPQPVAGVQQRELDRCVSCLACFLGCSASLVLLSERMMLHHPSSQCLPALQQWLERAATGQAGLQQLQQQLSICWAGRVYGLSLMLQDLTPTIGLWWYFFTEVFTEFRPFFLFVFHSFAAALALPVAIRFSSRPVFVAWVLLLTSCMFRPYACVGDMVPWLSLLPLLQQQLQSMRLRMFLVNSGVLLLVLGPAMWHQWIVVDSANANFFYSITLLLGVWYTLVLMQLLRLTCLLDRCQAGKGPPPRTQASSLVAAPTKKKAV